MPSNADDHDRLAWRLTAILLKLNQGDQVAPEQLAEEFSVHPRTIRRDLHERFAFLPLQRKEGAYRLDPAYLGKLNYRDLERFAALAGVSGLFPRLDAAFLRELFDKQLQDTLLVQGPIFEPLDANAAVFDQLRLAIAQHRPVQLTYKKPEGQKRVRVLPYRLINHMGVWYLAATDQDAIKAYALSRIAHLDIKQDERFEPQPHIQALVEQEDSIWLNEKKTEAVLTVSAEVASYFRRRALIPQQRIDKEIEDGGLIISGKFAHPSQLLPIVRYWLPHLRIVSPSPWQEQLEQGLRNYLHPRQEAPT